MVPITEEEEKRIDNSKNIYGTIRYVDKDGNIILGEDIFLYGLFNPEDDDDLDYIEQFNLINDETGGYIYSDFDYDKGTINSKGLRYFTFDPIQWFLYIHCLIGKPERIIVYRKIK